MRHTLASLVVAASLLSVASSEASAWVCRAVGIGSGGYGPASPSSMPSSSRCVDARIIAPSLFAPSCGVGPAAEVARKDAGGYAARCRDKPFTERGPGGRPFRQLSDGRKARVPELLGTGMLLPDALRPPNRCGLSSASRELLEFDPMQRRSGPRS